MDSKLMCKICGCGIEIHQAGTLHCPCGGIEAPTYEDQLWADSKFVPFEETGPEGDEKRDWVKFRSRWVKSACGYCYFCMEKGVSAAKFQQNVAHDLVGLTKEDELFYPRLMGYTKYLPMFISSARKDSNTTGK